MTPRSSALPRSVRIHYLRPPDRRTLYRQTLVHDDGRVKVTLASPLDIEAPLRIEGETALEAGSDAVWFTFPGAWHDIGRFHRADGTLTGIYANVITPCLFEPGGVWHTTDLFLDLWMPAGPSGEEPPAGAARLIDRDELDRAQAAGHLAPGLAARAREEGERLLRSALDGGWPPPSVREWTRERARDAARPR